MGKIKETVNEMFSDSDIETAYIENENEHKSKSKAILIMIIIAAMLFAICIILLVASMTIRNNAAKAAYKNAKPQVISTAYDKMGDKIYKVGEQRYHTSNRVGIKIDNIKINHSLDVLKVTDIFYYFGTENQKSKECYKVTGMGKYSVNMSLAEVITDEERDYILIRVPKPTFESDNFDVTVKKFNDKKKAFLATKVGEDTVEEAKKAGERQIKAKIMSNQYYSDSAEEAAKLQIIRLAKQSNPNLKVNVEVEFFD